MLKYLKIKYYVNIMELQLTKLTSSFIYLEIDPSGSKIPIGLPFQNKNGWTFKKAETEMDMAKYQGTKVLGIARVLKLNKTILCIDIDDATITYDEVIALYPFLSDTCYVNGNTKGFHFYVNASYSKNNLDCFTDVKGDIIVEQMFELEGKKWTNEIQDITQDQLIGMLKNKEPDVEKEVYIKQEQLEKIEFTPFYRAIVDNISKEKYTNYIDWMKFIGTFSHFTNGVDLADEYSQHVDGYRCKEDVEKNMTFSTDIGYLVNLSKKSNPTIHKAIVLKDKEDKKEYQKEEIKGRCLLIERMKEDKKLTLVKAKDQDKQAKLDAKEQDKQAKLETKLEKQQLKSEKDAEKQEQKIEKALKKQARVDEAEEKVQAQSDTNIALFERERDKIEKNHCLIKDEGFYIYTNGNAHFVKSEEKLRISYHHITCGVHPVFQTPINFFDKWCKNNDNIRAYQHIGIHPSICPPNTFNLWTPFEAQLMESNQKDISSILNHIFIMCGREQPIYDYFIQWLAQMVQFPEVKSICPVLISKPGAGKGTLLTLITRMLGGSKVLITSNPSRDVWGSFNGAMNNAFLVNLNELSKKDVLESYGHFKQLVTDPQMMINDKGVSQYKITSYHRFISTSNSEDPMPTSKDDRRTFIIRSSDELILNIDYFNELDEKIQDDGYVRTFYEYLMKIPDMKAFRKIPIPFTEYHKALQELSVSPIQRWVQDMVLSKLGSNEVDFKMTSSECYFEFNLWCKANYPKYEVSNVQSFSMRFKNLTLNGITQYKDRKGSGFNFNFSQLKE